MNATIFSQTNKNTFFRKKYFLRKLKHARIGVNGNNFLREIEKILLKAAKLATGERVCKKPYSVVKMIFDCDVIIEFFLINFGMKIFCAGILGIIENFFSTFY